jgi:hypothetical protein
VNLREGTRRVRLVLGFSGVCVGLFGTFSLWGSLNETKKESEIWLALIQQTGVQTAIRHARADPSQLPDVPVHEDGIDFVAINDPMSLEPAIIHFQDGGYKIRTDPPKLYQYVLSFLFPFVGFAIPWGTLKLLVCCPSHRISNDSSGGIGIGPAERLCDFGVGANVFANFAG